MRRGLRLALGIAVVSALLAGEARAQYGPYYYPLGYGGYGWGGWGGTVQGDLARGLGYYAMGAGIYNRQTAIADAINADTIMRWNQYLYLSQMEANRREYERRARLRKRDRQTSEIIYKRLRDNPTPADITNGDALNVILDQITDPRLLHNSALRLINDPVSSAAIAAIPFVHASDAVTISLSQLTAKGHWPIGLSGERFAPERAAYQNAVAQALQEDTEGDIALPTIQKVRDAASRLRAKFEKSPPRDRDTRLEAENYLKALIGMSRMLGKPNVDRLLAELEKAKTTSLGSLLAFMHTYNLRFGVANTPEARAVYEQLYPMMAAQRDRVLKEADGAENQPATFREDAPTGFFQGMHLDEEKADNSVPSNQ
jgi:hypothetical protein